MLIVEGSPCLQVSAGVALRFKKLTLQEADALRQETNKQVAFIRIPYSFLFPSQHRGRLLSCLS